MLQQRIIYFSTVQEGDEGHDSESRSHYGWNAYQKDGLSCDPYCFDFVLNSCGSSYYDLDFSNVTSLDAENILGNKDTDTLIKGIEVRAGIQSFYSYESQLRAPKGAAVVEYVSSQRLLGVGGHDQVRE